MQEKTDQSLARSQAGVLKGLVSRRHSFSFKRRGDDIADHT